MCIRVPLSAANETPVLPTLQSLPLYMLPSHILPETTWGRTGDKWKKISVFQALHLPHQSRNWSHSGYTGASWSNQKYFLDFSGQGSSPEQRLFSEHMRVNAKLIHCPELFKSEVPAICVWVKKTFCLEGEDAASQGLAGPFVSFHIPPICVLARVTVTCTSIPLPHTHTRAAHHPFPRLSSPILISFVSQFFKGTLCLLPFLFYLLYPTSSPTTPDPAP